MVQSIIVKRPTKWENILGPIKSSGFRNYYSYILFCQISYLKQFSNEFEVLYLRESDPWIGECSVSLISSGGSTFPEEFWAIVSFRVLKEIIWLAGIASLTLFRKIKEQGNKYRAELTWSLGIGWIDTLHFWSSGAFTGMRKSSRHGTSGRSGSILGLEIYGNSYMFLFFKYETVKIFWIMKSILFRIRTRHGPPFSKTVFSFPSAFPTPVAQNSLALLLWLVCRPLMCLNITFWIQGFSLALYYFLFFIRCHNFLKKWQQGNN